MLKPDLGLLRKERCWTNVFKGVATVSKPNVPTWAHTTKGQKGMRLASQHPADTKSAQFYNFICPKLGTWN